MEDLSQFNRKVRIEKLLRAAFPVASFDVFDDSKEHAGLHSFVIEKITSRNLP